MSSQLDEYVARLRRDYFANPAADQELLAAAVSRGVPSALIDFYRLCNGALLGVGEDFRAPNGNEYRFRIPPLEQLKSVQQQGYISDDSPFYQSASRWWQIVDYCDANWLAYDANNVSGRIIDIFHETAGQPGYHTVVATSLADLLERLTSHNDVYWFRDDFSPVERF